MDRTEYYRKGSVAPPAGGSIRPPEDYPDKLSGVSGLAGATTHDSFQTRLEIILQNKGIEILQDSDLMFRLLQDSDMDRKTRNVFRTILMTDAVACFVSYAQEQMREEELVRRCNMILQDEWGMSPAAFRPVIKQILNAIDEAIQVRRDSVGKTICNQLKEMRRRFAAANQIEYHEEDCTETRPCEGTCPYCEERTKYLVNEAMKIATTRDVVYPQISEDEFRKVYPPIDDETFGVDGQIKNDTVPIPGGI